MPYTSLANSQWVNVYDVQQCQGHAHYDNNYNCHITAIELINQSNEVHITPLVINGLGGGHTHTDTHTNTHTNTHIHIQTIRTGSILRNQVRAWFNKLSHTSVQMNMFQ